MAAKVPRSRRSASDTTPIPPCAKSDQVVGAEIARRKRRFGGRLERAAAVWPLAESEAETSAGYEILSRQSTPPARWVDMAREDLAAARSGLAGAATTATRTHPEPARLPHKLQSGGKPGHHCGGQPWNGAGEAVIHAG
jgi:hypothetical protein